MSATIIAQAQRAFTETAPVAAPLHARLNPTAGVDTYINVAGYKFPADRDSPARATGAAKLVSKYYLPGEAR